VEFIPVKYGKTPDMSVDYKGTKFYVECKKKEAIGSKEKLIDSIFRRIMDHSFNVMAYEKINMKIDLVFHNIPTNNDLILIESTITDVIRRKIRGSIQVKEIAQINSGMLFPYDLFIPYIPSFEGISQGGWLGSWTMQSYHKEIPIEGLFDLTAMDSRILASLKTKNLCIVRYKSPNVTSLRIDSIANTVASQEDTLHKFKDYHPGVIFLELDVTPNTYARDFELLIKMVRVMLETEKFSQIWAVVILATIFHEEGKVAGFQTLIATSFNNNANIPDHIRDLLTGKTT
jgi:hypothetical protein